LAAQLLQAQQQNESLVEKVLEEMGARLREAEGCQELLQKQIAQMAGSVRGLDDELHAQAKRGRSDETWCREMKRSVEGGVHAHVTDLEQKLDKLAVTRQADPTVSEDHVKRHGQRLLHLEGVVEDLMSGEAAGPLIGIVARVEALEQSRRAEARSPLLQSLSNRLDAIEGKLRAGDIAAKLDRLAKEALSSQSRLEEHEVRLAALRSRLDSQEEGHRTLGDKLEGIDFEGRLDHVHHMIRDHKQSSTQDLDKASQRMEELEAGHRALRAEVFDAVRSEYDQLVLGLADVGTGSGASGLSPETNGDTATPMDTSPVPLSTGGLCSSEFAAVPRDLEQSLHNNQDFGLHSVVQREATRVAERATRTLAREVSELSSQVADLQHSASTEPTRARISDDGTSVPHLSNTGFALLQTQVKRLEHQLAELRLEKGVPTEAMPEQASPEELSLRDSRIGSRVPDINKAPTVVLPPLQKDEVVQGHVVPPAATVRPAVDQAVTTRGLRSPMTSGGRGLRGISFSRHDDEDGEDATWTEYTKLTAKIDQQVHIRKGARETVSYEDEPLDSQMAILHFKRGAPRDLTGLCQRMVCDSGDDTNVSSDLDSYEAEKEREEDLDSPIR